MKKCLIVVAQPDRIPTWVGNTILTHPSWSVLVVCLCKKNDDNRALGFKNAMSLIAAKGVKAYLDSDGGYQTIKASQVERALIGLLPETSYDLVITHKPQVESTQNRRFEETAQAVINLWTSGRFTTKELWLFAKQDNRSVEKIKPPKSVFLNGQGSSCENISTIDIPNDKGATVSSSQAVEMTLEAEDFVQFTSPFEATIWWQNNTTQM